MLTEAELSRYQEEGFVIPDFRFSDDTIQSIRENHSRLIERFPEFTDYCPALFVHDVSFLDYARDEALLDMIEQVLGPNIAIWNSSFFAKPAKVGTRTPWHQDGEYWPIRPLATCSVWIAVDDADESNGCLQFLPGSHKSRNLSSHHVNSARGLALPLELDESAFDENQAVSVVLEAGQVSLHDVYLMHASDPNSSDRPRRGMTLRFMPTSSVYRRDLEASSSARLNLERTLFLMRGIDQSGQNDFRVRPVCLN